MKENNNTGESSNGRKAVFEIVNVSSTLTSPSTKICSRCQVDKELIAFAIRKDGRYGRTSECKECHQKNSKAKYNEQERIRVRADTERRRKIAREYVAELKAKSKCKCGYKGAALQFHHLGNKDTEVSRAVGDGWSLERLIKEIEKCVIMCANCHIEEHTK